MPNVRKFGLYLINFYLFIISSNNNAKSGKTLELNKKIITSLESRSISIRIEKYDFFLKPNISSVTFVSQQMQLNKLPKVFCVSCKVSRFLSRSLLVSKTNLTPLNKSIRFESIRSLLLFYHRRELLNV